jgi:glycosyltransferase involved in cell wall biosynthesis
VDTSLLRLVQSHRPELRERVEVVMNFTDLADDQGAGPDTPGTDACLQPLLDARRQGHTVVLVPRNLSLVRGGGWLPDLAERAVATLPPGNQCDFFLTGVAVDVYGQAKRYTTLLQRELQSRSEAARASMHLLGGLPHSAMAAAYRASDIVLIPTFACEGTSLAALEAMGLGVPVVATNVGGLNDIVRDGVTGFLVPPDPQALASAVARLAENSELRLRLGAEGRRMVAGAFTREHWRTRAEGFACRAGWASAN